MRTIIEHVREFSRNSKDQLREFAELFANLSSTDICSVSNFSKLKRLIKIVLTHDKDAFDSSIEPHLLNNILVEHIEQLQDICFTRFDRMWSAKQNDNKFWLVYEGAKRGLDVLKIGNQEDPKKVYITNTYSKHDMESFNGYLKLMRGSKKDEAFSTSWLTNMLEIIHPQLLGDTHLTKLDKERGRRERLSSGEAANYLDRYLLRPCNAISQLEETHTILKPVVELGLLTNMVGVKLRERQFYFWAWNYMRCDLLLGMNQVELAKKISEYHNTRERAH